jgi:hypothetical protein
MSEERPDLSTQPFNYFAVEDHFKFSDPFAVAMSKLFPGNTYGRVDLLTPMGCHFSLFIVRGWAEGDEDGTLGAMVCSLVIFEELAGQMAGQLRDASVTEVRYNPESHTFEAQEIEFFPAEGETKNG